MDEYKNNDRSHQSIIESSWRRCRDAGLAHSSTPVIEMASDADFTSSLDQHHGLLQTTQQKVLPFYDNLLSNSNCLVMLADTNGQVLNSWGEQRFFQENQPHVFRHGVHWQEGLIGTNAIGTALETGNIVQIFHDEHFLASNRFMTGSAAPLFDADRRMTGVLAISSDTYMPTAHTLGMVKLMSQAIENQLIVSRFNSDHYLFWFNTSEENIDSQWSCLLVFNEQGTIVSANRRAEVVLGCDLALQNLDQLFDVRMDQLLAHPSYTPLVLRSKHNFNFHGIVMPPKIPQGRSLDFRNAPKPAAKAVSKDDVLDLERLNMGDPRLSKAITQASKILNTDIPILINGETGVGKEVFVNALHLSSERSQAPLIAVNCAAIPSELVESELFGYEKGAFTGAHTKGYIGLIRKADKGTLFLDELGDMPLNVQARLLRVLQERKVTPLGSTTSYPVDFKLVSATNRHLKQDVEAGKFRQDLYYRVSGLNITLPPLRERTDKDALVQYLLSKFSSGDQPGQISMEVLSLFKSHPWPGNIRQMVSVIQIALAMAEPEAIQVDDLPDDFLADVQSSTNHDSNIRPFVAPVNTSFQSQTTVEEKEDWLEAYERMNRNISKTAKELNISRNTLYKRLRESGLK
ncbi:sigma-54-dependent Fis family transcriptional regulator [Vibrio nigripulchritudo]|uniref:sigma-54-dependent Fis family transcriptional regulator n=1 Tax=Vibrio nigripulchritudo TaxID=28173 RepID=UPI00190A6D05|nr:sigma-54-dependent Fis family transcriptional regulator [Vibrio nigripulchritudo]BCL73236.1 sigma-54-dependent Fis family transcriptional regulator [Vibrio nigripulchritudo]BDU34600.1 sigma-54-dependent Fis family transcriptional regulator [Vibrio nigripulchritudo]